MNVDVEVRQVNIHTHYYVLLGEAYRRVGLPHFDIQYNIEQGIINVEVGALRFIEFFPLEHL